MIRVLIVDDHEFVRAMVRRVLGAADGILVVGEAVDGSAVLDAAEMTRPDVVLMDVRMPVTSGIDATRFQQPAILAGQAAENPRSPADRLGDPAGGR